MKNYSNINQHSKSLSIMTDVMHELQSMLSENKLEMLAVADSTNSNYENVLVMSIKKDPKPFNNADGSVNFNFQSIKSAAITESSLIQNINTFGKQETIKGLKQFFISNLFKNC